MPIFSDNLAAAIAYTGAALAAIGTLGVAFVEARSRKSASRGQAADIITNGYTADRLRSDNIQLRKAVIGLLEAEAQHKTACNHSDTIIAIAVAVAERVIIENY